MTNSNEQSDWYGPDAATFGDRLAAARDAAGMTQEVLAKRMGVKLATLQNWEEDLSEPRANKLSMISGILNVSMVWLITGEGEGVSAPDVDALSPDVTAVLAEIRAMRARMQAQAEKLGRLEKSLRVFLKEQV
ncbi:helix-turn-helix domain-containing protein [Tropicibacter oceani]|uniref:Helix-turn-helix domain-containing protein n=1 Tax=Tropicibacter oceani TaxID=3058420 RepID=A0ABY8QLC2_9RHOB|nr:helix-turn-helix domain-containing protein [Tropicibacter oceani]WGW05441.1 helix-turn-helix domain-containing protein [Tropicibacter oceani]